MSGENAIGIATGIELPFFRLHCLLMILSELYRLCLVLVQDSVVVSFHMILNMFTFLIVGMLHGRQGDQPIHLTGFRARALICAQLKTSLLASS